MRRRKHRPGEIGWFRAWLGAQALWLWWVLHDPHEKWAIEYRGQDGGRYSLVHDGPYSTAVIRAREVGGCITGWRVLIVPWGNPADRAA